MLFWKQCFHIQSVKVKIVRALGKFGDPSGLRNPPIRSMTKRRLINLDILYITKSGTRREELLFDKADLQKMNVLRRIIAPMGSMDAIEFINSKLKNTKNNGEFFNSMNKPS